MPKWWHCISVILESYDVRALVKFKSLDYLHWLIPRRNMPKHAFIQRGESIYYAFLFIPVGPKGIRVIIPSLAAEYTHKNLMAICRLPWATRVRSCKMVSQAFNPSSLVSFPIRQPVWCNGRPVPRPTPHIPDAKGRVI